MWERALDLALKCRNKFGEDVTSLADTERRSTEALGLLTLRTRAEVMSASPLLLVRQSISRFSQFTGKKDMLSLKT